MCWGGGAAASPRVGLNQMIAMLAPLQLRRKQNYRPLRLEPQLRLQARTPRSGLKRARCAK
jgi:hypothetical protein